MTAKQALRLMNKLARVQHELEHDADRLPEHSYAQRALIAATQQILHAASMIEIYHVE